MFVYISSEKMHIEHVGQQKKVEAELFSLSGQSVRVCLWCKHSSSR